MKHLNKMLAAAALTLPFMASAAVGDYTVTPAPGVVEELTQFTITFESDGMSEAELVDTSSVEVRKDGKFYSEVKSKALSKFAYQFTLKTPASEAGEYEVVVAAEAFELWSSGYTSSEYNDRFSVVYTVEGAAPQPGAYTVTPEPGVVEELTKFTLSFESAGLQEVYVDSYSVNVLKDGKAFSEVTKKEDSDYQQTFTLKTPATEPGEYQIVIDSMGITYYAEGYASEWYNEKAITFDYTIKAPLTEGVVYDIEITKFNPAAGSEIDLVNFQFDNVKMYTSGTGLKLNPAGTTVTVTSDNGYSSTGSFRMPYANYYYAPIQNVTKNGTYTIVVPAATVVDAEYIETEGKSGHANAETTITYTCINGAPAGEPVVYDLDIVSTTPVQGTLDLTSKSFESVNIKLPEGCAFAEDKFTLTMTAPLEQGDIELNFSSSWNGYLAFFDEPTYNGEYIVVIPEGSFGDAAWIANHEFGHANEEIALKWTLIGGMPTSVEVINAENLNNAPVYDLNGVRVADSLREAGNGLFVVNGQKVIVKK